MRKQVIMKDFEVGSQEISYSAAQLAATLKASGLRRDYPSWISNLFDSTVLPVKIVPAEALKGLLLMKANGTLPIHPGNTLETLVMSTTLKITKDSVQGMKGSNVDMTAELGILTKPGEEHHKVLAAVTADLVAYETSVVTVNGMPALAEMKWNKLMPQVNMVPIRDSLFHGDVTRNVIEARDGFYSSMIVEKMNAKDIATVHCTHHIVGSVLPNYKEQEDAAELKPMVNKVRASMNLKPLKELTQCTPVFTGFKVTKKMDVAYKYFQANISIRGTDGKRGKLSKCYTMFDMPGAMLSTIGRARDVLNLSDFFETTIVISTTLKVEEKRVLVANGLTIIDPNCFSTDWTSDSQPGLYSLGEENPKDYFAYFDANKSITLPNYASKAFSYKCREIKKIETKLVSHRKYAINVHINPCLASAFLYPDRKSVV